MRELILAAALALALTADAAAQTAYPSPTVSALTITGCTGLMSGNGSSPITCGGSTGGGSGSVNAGSTGQLAYYAAPGAAVSGLNVGAGLLLSGGTISSPSTAAAFAAVYALKGGL